MMKLMQQCDYVDKRHELTKKKTGKLTAVYQRDKKATSYSEDYPNDAPTLSLDDEEDGTEEPAERGIFSASPLSLLSGVFPGNSQKFLFNEPC